jgi:hypothetical protein
MQDTREKRIGPYVYKVTQLDAEEGIVMGMQLLRMIGPTAAGMIEGTVGAKSDGVGSIAAGAAQALRELSQLANPSEYLEYMKKLSHHTTVVIDKNTEPRLDDIFKEHFAGHYDWVRQWFAFALEVNFTSFFGGAGGLKTLQEHFWKLLQSASPSTSPDTSTGTSTASQPAATTEAQA